jgi:hypothetical protein
MIIEDVTKAYQKSSFSAFVLSMMIAETAIDKFAESTGMTKAEAMAIINPVAFERYREFKEVIKPKNPKKKRVKA